MKKKPLISVIVPTRNSSACLKNCLKSITGQSYNNIELIVVDNNSSDDTKKIARKYTDKVYNKGPERSAQRNFGAKQSKGTYLLIIDSDMELTKDVVKACVEKAGKDDQIKAIVIPEESFGEGFWAQCKKLERSFYVGVDWMEAARFFERRAFEEMNGYDEQMTGAEDYDLPQRMKFKYGAASFARTEEFIMHNEQKISLIKTCKKKFYYAQGISRYKKSNKESLRKQSSVIKRYKLFLSQPKKLIQNPITGVAMLFMKTAEMVAGGLGYVNSQVKEKKNEKCA